MKYSCIEPHELVSIHVLNKFVPGNKKIQDSAIRGTQQNILQIRNPIIKLLRNYLYMMTLNNLSTRFVLECFYFKFYKMLI